MTEKSHHNNRNPRQPVGFTPRSSGLAGEYAREQGWGLNEEERRKAPATKQNFDGGTDYDYGARDFGDSAVDTSRARPGANQSQSANQSAEKRTATKKNSHSRP